MLLSVSVNAFAWQPKGERVDGVQLAEVFEAQKNISFFALPSASDLRWFYFSEGIRYGAVSASKQTTLVSRSEQIRPETTVEPIGDYHIETYTNTSGFSTVFIGVQAGTYFDFSVDADYKASEYETLVVSGDITAYIYNYWNGISARIFPNTVQVLLNGVPSGDVVNLSSTGADFENIEIPIEEDITQIGYRFTYTAANSGSNSLGATTDTCDLLAHVDDDGVWYFAERVADDPNTGLLEGILGWIIGIYNSVFVPDSQKDDADNFQSEVSDTVAGADEVKDELEQLEKPNPEDIDTDLSDIITDDAYTQQTQIFADLLRFDKITDMLMIVFTMALISYVLFGKKG